MKKDPVTQVLFLDEAMKVTFVLLSYSFLLNRLVLFNHLGS